MQSVDLLLRRLSLVLSYDSIVLSKFLGGRTLLAGVNQSPQPLYRPYLIQHATPTFLTFRASLPAVGGSLPANPLHRTGDTDVTSKAANDFLP